MSNYRFKKSDGGPVSKANAQDWIEKYKKAHPDGPWAFFFGEDIINKVINHPEAVGMRVYFGYDSNRKLQLVLLGAREDGSNIWPGDPSAAATVQLKQDDATAGDQGMTCPPYCP